MEKIKRVYITFLNGQHKAGLAVQAGQVFNVPARDVQRLDIESLLSIVETANASLDEMVGHAAVSRAQATRAFSVDCGLLVMAVIFTVVGLIITRRRISRPRRRHAT